MKKIEKGEKNIDHDIEKGEKTIEDKIFYNIRELKKSLNDSKHKWMQIGNNDGFYFYYAIFNVEIILDEIKNKLHNNFKTIGKNSEIVKDKAVLTKENAKMAKNNSEIAAKSLILWPTINDIFKKTELCDIDEESIKFVLDKTQALRNMATDEYLPKSFKFNEEFLRYSAQKFDQKMKVISDNPIN